MSALSKPPVEPRLCCPLCGNAALVEFYEPPGVALCVQCGLLLRRLRDRLAPLYGVAPDRINLYASLRNDLGADSLDQVELVMELEEEFDITIPDQVVERMETIEDIILYIKSRRRNRRD
ncbi:MAG: acyl carrier protein [Planctomycetes bacterium]|nr:acyl carrier protein [Planctomycetota bacterium]